MFFCWGGPAPRSWTSPSPLYAPGSPTPTRSSPDGWLPVPVLVVIVMGVITAVILARTYVGRAMYAIGGNEEAARLSRIRVKRQKLIIYALSGLTPGWR